VHEDNGTIAKVLVAGDSMYNGVAAVVLPVERITVRYKSKDKCFKGNFTEILQCFSKKKILLDRNSIFYFYYFIVQ